MFSHKLIVTMQSVVTGQTPKCPGLAFASPIRISPRRFPWQRRRSPRRQSLLRSHRKLPALSLLGLRCRRRCSLEQRPIPRLLLTPPVRPIDDIREMHTVGRGCDTKRRLDAQRSGGFGGETSCQM